MRLSEFENLEMLVHLGMEIDDQLAIRILKSAKSVINPRVRASTVYCPVILLPKHSFPFVASQNIESVAFRQKVEDYVHKNIFRFDHREYALRIREFIQWHIVENRDVLTLVGCAALESWTIPYDLADWIQLNAFVLREEKKAWQSYRWRTRETK